MSRCQYCFQFANDIREVNLRPDGETWKHAYASRVCGKCRTFLNQTRQFRYRKPARSLKPEKL